MSKNGWVFAFDGKEIEAYHDSFGTEVIDSVERFGGFAYNYGY